MSTRMGAGRVRATYEFIEAHRGQYSVQTLYWILDVAPSGYYAWLYVDAFYHSTRRHSHLGGLSPEAFEATQKSQRRGVH